MGTMVRQGPMHSANSISSYLTPDASTIVMASLDHKTKTAYLRVWGRFKTFCKGYGLSSQLPISVILLLNFLTSLFQLGHQPSTIASNVSALAFIHRMLGYPDPTTTFLVRHFLKGAKKLKGSAVDMRLPITTVILYKLISAIPTVVMLSSHRSLLKAVFLLCFNAFLRMGEICLKSGYPAPSVVQRPDVSFSYDAGRIVGASIILRHFKNNLKHLPVTLFLPLNLSNVQCCPVKAIESYFLEYQHTSGPLFQFHDGSPVTYSFVADKLNLIIRYIGLDQSRYKPHSFRIGAATSAYCQGYSEDDIKRMGRWESNAVRRYIRLNTFSF